MSQSSFVFNPCRFMLRDLDSLLTFVTYPAGLRVIEGPKNKPDFRSIFRQKNREVSLSIFTVFMELEQPCNDSVFSDVHAQSSRFFRQTWHGQDIPRQRNDEPGSDFRNKGTDGDVEVFRTADRFLVIG